MAPSESVEGRLSFEFPYRPALDGLRAVAVIAVIVYHLNSAWLPGGYLGVDLFFVLSGFLITSLLLIEHEGTGTIDLGRFWTRRIRRLLPASILVLIAVVVVTAIRGDVLDQSARRPEVLSALAYVINWEFIMSGQSYFEGFSDVSPLRHYWSLAIEEQFYLIWPLTVFGLTRLGRRRRVWLVAAVAAVSSAVAMTLMFDPVDSSRSYFGSDTRIHQILVGCLLALALRTGTVKNLLPRARLVLPFALGAMALTFVLLDDTASLYYQGGAALLAVLVATAIAGLESPSLARRALSWRPLVWIGSISYGLYLWHWPLIRFVNTDTVGLAGMPLAMIRVGATFAIATLSYYVVEQPIRRGHLGRLTVDRKSLIRQVPLVTGCVAFVSFFALSGPIPEWMRDPVSQPQAIDPGPITSVSSDEHSSAETGLVVGVVGDSVMVSMLPGFRELATDHGWTLVEGAIQACPIGYEPLYGYDEVISPYFEQYCETGVPEAHRLVSAAHPDLIIWHDLQSALPRRAPNGDFLEPGSDRWVDELVTEWSDAIEQIASSPTSIAVIYPPFRSQDDPGCTNSTRESRCLTIQRQDHDIRLAVDRLMTMYSGPVDLSLISLDEILCPAGYPCPERVDNVEVRVGANDQTHFTETGAVWIKDYLLNQFAIAQPEIFTDLSREQTIDTMAE